MRERRYWGFCYHRVLVKIVMMNTATSVLLLLAAASATSYGFPLDEPMLFMDLQDVASVWGRVTPVANSAQPIPGLECPPENYTKGATVFASFRELDGSSQYEIYVAVGRSGEPLSTLDHPEDVADGVDREEPGKSKDIVVVKRYTTADFKSYSSPTVVLSLPEMDDKKWTVKSMDRSVQTGQYILLAFGTEGAHSFTSDGPPKTTDSLKPTSGSLSKANFVDHDDTNIIYSRCPNASEPWVDMQIMYDDVSITMPKTYAKKKYCDNIGDEYRRVVSVRTSRDGKTWTQDAGCLDKPQTSEHCQTFDVNGMIRPVLGVDAPELEFYRIRPFYLGNTSRLAAHALLYAPGPMQLGKVKNYGRQPPSCKSDGCCHGPHMYEEWWVGPNDGNPTNLSQWRRPFYDVHAFPHDIWAMSQPVIYNNSHVWVDNGVVWGLPLYRLAGLFTESNGEITTKPFEMPGDALWINAHALWEGGNHVGGCDEGCAAYIMVELLNATSGDVLPGYERSKCIMVNVDGLRIPVAWKAGRVLAHGTSMPTADNIDTTTEASTGTEFAGQLVQAKIYFRDATVYALGHGQL